MYYKKGDFEKMKQYHILDCFECGSCSFNCPARMPLTHSFKTAKLMFKAKQQKDWATSDLIRDNLAALGFEVKDTKDGFSWKLNK